tara:strand:- start:58 stop:387 length:330 start_codon:yes stop_codon:yes gene_type:complete
MSYWVLLVDAREPGEVSTYHFLAGGRDDETAPQHMLRMFQRSADKTFENVYFDDGSIESTDGLVNEEHPDADNRAQEIQSYLNSKCKREHLFKPRSTNCIQVYISMIQP